MSETITDSDEPAVKKPAIDQRIITRLARAMWMAEISDRLKKDDREGRKADWEASRARFRDNARSVYKQLLALGATIMVAEDGKEDDAS